MDLLSHLNGIGSSPWTLETTTTSPSPLVTRSGVRIIIVTDKDIPGHHVGDNVATELHHPQEVDLSIEHHEQKRPDH